MTGPNPEITPDRPEPAQAISGPRGEPLAAQLHAAAYRLVLIPTPDRPLTDDQAAEVIAAAHLMMHASVDLDATRALVAHYRAAAARRERVMDLMVVGVLIAAALVCVIGITFSVFNR